MKHKEHKKRRLYARNQESGSKQWEATEIFLCECGAILEYNLAKTKTIKINGGRGNDVRKLR